MGITVSRDPYAEDSKMSLEVPDSSTRLELDYTT